jgi:hypothetical protein
MAKKPNANGMHVEYHTVNPKKDKAADCVFLDSNRVCYCKESTQYLTKCFIASYCPHKIKDGEVVAPRPTPSKQKPTPSKPKAYSNTPNHPAYGPKVITSIDCTLPLGCMVYSKAFGKGYFRSYDKKTRRIYFEFADGKMHCFSYPDVFDKGYLALPTEFKDYVKNDKLKAK